MPGRSSPQCGWLSRATGNKYEVEHRGRESDALPGPVAVREQSHDQNQQCAQDGDCGRDAEVSEAGADGDELGDQREKVADHEVDHGEPSPEGSEAVEDEFGVSAMSGGAEAHRHFLDDAGHDEGEDDERQEEPDAEARAGRGIRQHAGPVVFAEHDQDAGADEQPQQPGSMPDAGAGALGGDALAVVSAVDIFVGDD